MYLYCGSIYVHVFQKLCETWKSVLKWSRTKTSENLKAIWIIGAAIKKWISHAANGSEVH